MVLGAPRTQFDVIIIRMFIKIKVFPKTRNERVEKVKEDKFELFIRAEAKNGEANMRVVEIMQGLFPQAKFVRIIKGQTTPNKIVEIGE